MKSIQSIRQLLHILGVDRRKIKYALANVDRLYYEFEKIKEDSNGLPKRLKDGTIEKRLITASLSPLKLIQSRIAKRVLRNLPVSKCAHGGLLGKSNITNAKIHKGKKYHFQTDVRHFYPSITNTMVYQMLLSHGFPHHVASILTRLMTRNGAVPQGVATSSYVANLVFADIDNRIGQLLTQNSAYTRLIDDLTISTTEPIDQTIIDRVIQAITTEGFRIHPRKTFYKVGPIDITGTRVSNNQLRPSQKVLQKSQRPNLSEQTRRAYDRYFLRIREA